MRPRSAAIADTAYGSIAVTYVEWAGTDYQQTVVDWRVVEDAGSAKAFADALAFAPVVTARWTSISAALDYAVTLFDANGFDGMRQVIDISGDGYNNRGERDWSSYQSLVDAARDLPDGPPARQATRR